MVTKAQQDESLSDVEIQARMDRGIRRSLTTPPKTHKMMREPRQKRTKSTASDAKSENPSE